MSMSSIDIPTANTFGVLARPEAAPYRDAAMKSMPAMGGFPRQDSGVSVSIAGSSGLGLRRNTMPYVAYRENDARVAIAQAAADINQAKDKKEKKEKKEKTIRDRLEDFGKHCSKFVKMSRDELLVSLKRHIRGKRHASQTPYYNACGMTQQDSQVAFHICGLLANKIGKKTVTTADGEEIELLAIAQRFVFSTEDVWGLFAEFIEGLLAIAGPVDSVDVDRWMDVMRYEMESVGISELINKRENLPLGLAWGPVFKVVTLFILEKNDKDELTKAYWDEEYVEDVLKHLTGLPPLPSKGNGKRARDEDGEDGEDGEAGEAGEPKAKKAKVEKPKVKKAKADKGPKGPIKTCAWFRKKILEAVDLNKMDDVQTLRAELKKREAKKAAKKAAAPAKAPVVPAAVPADVMDLTNDEIDGKTAAERDQEIREKHIAEMAANAADAAASAPQGPVQVQAIPVHPAAAVTEGVVLAPPPIVNEVQEQNVVQEQGKRGGGLRKTHAPRGKGQPAPKNAAAAKKAKAAADKEAKEAKAAAAKEAKKAKAAAAKREAAAARVAAAAKLHAQASSSDSSESEEE